MEKTRKSVDYSLFYFSGTGNTKLVFSEIKKGYEVKKKVEAKVSNLALSCSPIGKNTMKNNGRKKLKIV